MSTPQMESAREYVAAGLSVIPVKLDGTKAPAYAGWREYATRRPTDAELHRWFGRPDLHGIGVPCGYGGLAALDFEAEAAFASWIALVPTEVAALVAGSPTVATGGGGRHVWCRLSFPVPAGTVMARAANKDVLIEVRGAGHQVVAPGSPPHVHTSGVPYLFTNRGWIDASAPPAVWSEDAWRAALTAARSLNEYVSPGRTIGEAPPRTLKPGRTDHDRDRPGDRFARVATWDAILRPHGWRVVGRFDDRTLWRRPGKDKGVSATAGFCKSEAGEPLLYVFSTNAAPFEAGRAYGLFGAYVMLNHGGDFRAGAVELANNGYGSERRRITVRIGKAVGA